MSTLRTPVKSLANDLWNVDLAFHPVNENGYTIVVERSGGDPQEQFAAVLIFDNEGIAISVDHKDYGVEDALQLEISHDEHPNGSFVRWEELGIDKRDIGEVVMRIEPHLPNQVIIGFSNVEDDGLPHLADVIHVKCRPGSAVVDLHDPVEEGNLLLGVAVPFSALQALARSSLPKRNTPMEENEIEFREMVRERLGNDFPEDRIQQMLEIKQDLDKHLLLNILKAASVTLARAPYAVAINVLRGMRDKNTKIMSSLMNDVVYGALAETVFKKYKPALSQAEMVAYFGEEFEQQIRELYSARPTMLN